MKLELSIAALMLGAACGASCEPLPAASNAGAGPLLGVATANRDEPDVRHTLIEDDGARIDELRVRGQATRIAVTPKVGPRKRYEIITGDAGRDTFEGTGGARSAVGKRVWNVLDF